MRPETREIRGRDDGLLSVREAAGRLGLSVWTVYAWARTGRIPSVQLGKRRLFVASDLSNLIEVARARAANNELR